MLKPLISRLLERLGYELRRTPGAPKSVEDGPNPIHKWNDDAIFRALADVAEQKSLVDRVRLYMLYQLAHQVRTLQGDAAEIGVYRGGTARLLGPQFQSQGKRFHLFDTFSGMPATDPERDWHKAGDFIDTSLAQVQAFVAGHGDFEFYPGFFPQTATPALGGTSFAFVHVDVDIHQSVLDCCNYFYPRIVSGGVLVFDDYGFTTCPGAKLGVDSFFSGKRETPVYLPTGQAVVFKL